MRLGGTNSVAEAYVYDGDDKLIASGRGTYFTAAAKLRLSSMTRVPLTICTGDYDRVRALADGRLGIEGCD